MFQHLKTTQLLALAGLTLAVGLAPACSCGDDDKSPGPAANNATNNGTNNATNNGTNNDPNNANNTPACTTDDDCGNDEVCGDGGMCETDPCSLCTPDEQCVDGECTGGGGDCSEDANSPNHTPDAATAIELGVAYEDLAICPDASDYFTLDLAAGQTVQVGIFFSAEQGDLDLYAYSAGAVDPENPLAASEGIEDSEAVELVADEAGTFIIEVRGFDGAAAAYSLFAAQLCEFDDTCGDGQACLLPRNGSAGVCGAFEPAACGQGDDGEPNDTSSRATALTLADGNGSVSAEICEEDADIYSIQLDAVGSVTATATYTGPGDMDLYVVNADSGQVVAAGISEATDSETVTAPFLPAGTYHIRAFLFAGDPLSYELQVSVDGTPCTEIAECVEAIGRPFCVEGACGGIDGMGGVALGGACDSDDDCSDEADGCYSGSVDATGFVCTVVCNDDNACAGVGEGAYCAASLGACLLPCASDNACAAEDLCLEGKCVTRECLLDADCTREGDSCVPGTFGEEGQCQVFEPAECGQEDAGEPNDTDSRATLLTLEGGMVTVEGLMICDADIDFYAVELTEPGSLAVRVDYAGPADLDIYILGMGSARAVGLGLSTEADNEVAAAELLPAGTYFIRVVAFPGEESTTETYSLTASFTAETCADDDGCQNTSVLRLTCSEGSCVDFDGMGAVALGGFCDTSDDCVEDATLCFNAEGAAAEGQNICTIVCEADAECGSIAGSTCQEAGNAAFCLP